MKRRAIAWEAGNTLGGVLFLASCVVSVGGMGVARGVRAQGPIQIAAAGGCPGDCNGDGAVTVNELIRGVNIALGAAPLEACRELDADGNGEVTINELITAVNAVLTSCPEVPTATPTVTTTSVPTPTVPPSASATASPSQTVAPSESPIPTAIPSDTPTPANTVTASPTETSTPTETAEAVPTATVTETPDPAGEAIARSVALLQRTTTAFLTLPNLLSAILGHNFGSGTAGLTFEIGPVDFECGAGGGGSVTCSQDLIERDPLPPILDAPHYRFVLDQCAATPGEGRTLTLDGTVMLRGEVGDVCGTIPGSGTVTLADVTAVVAGSGGRSTARFAAVEARVDLGCSAVECECSYDTARMTVAGAITVNLAAADGEPVSATGVEFGTSEIQLTVHHFADACVPDMYSMRVEGGVQLGSDGGQFEGTFSGFVLRADASSGTDLLEVSGEVRSDCVAKPIDFSTTEMVQLPPGAACPVGGTLAVFDGDTGAIHYRPDGTVDIDAGYDGEIDTHLPHCLQPPFPGCAQE